MAPGSAIQNLGLLLEEQLKFFARVGLIGAGGL